MKTTQKSGNHSKKWKPLKKVETTQKKWKPLYEIQTKLGGLHENRNS
ncbi:hypothetical protein [Holdemanella porci]|nr:hypothetical protein [Holdemanella porci]MBU9130536.1 hypothetical protein [Holdemanella porci]